jgi:hypothetical protein
MTFRSKTLFSIVARLFFIAAVFGIVLIANLAVAGDAKPTDGGATQPTSVGPEGHDSDLTSIQPWIVDNQVLGFIASYVYKDVSTGRSADYWELYDETGNLLAVSWFDQFGIQRTAVDRGIVNDEDKLEGVFVIVSESDPV